VLRHHRGNFCAPERDLPAGLLPLLHQHPRHQQLTSQSGIAAPHLHYTSFPGTLSMRGLFDLALGAGLPLLTLLTSSTTSAAALPRHGLTKRRKTAQGHCSMGFDKDPSGDMASCACYGADGKTRKRDWTTSNHDYRDKAAALLCQELYKYT
jgi:hypothetical protein